MAKVTGSIDDRGRPVVRIELGSESLLCVIDTGFNGDLLLSESAAKSAGIVEGSRVARVELGDGRSTEVSQNNFNWIGWKRSEGLASSSTLHGIREAMSPSA